MKKLIILTLLLVGVSLSALSILEVDGEYWNLSSDEQKYGYVFGYISTTYFIYQVMLEEIPGSPMTEFLMTIIPWDAEIDELIRRLDILYEQEKYVPVPLIQAMYILSMVVNEESFTGARAKSPYTYNPIQSCNLYSADIKLLMAPSVALFWGLL